MPGREQIAADIERLEAEIQRLHRPEFTIGAGQAPPVVDVDALMAERAELRFSLADVERAAAAIGGLDVGAPGGEGTAHARHRGAGHRRRCGRRAARRPARPPRRAAQGGPSGESVPVVLNDPVSQAPAERRWELMDLLRRLGERTQVIYLTSGAFIGAWAAGGPEIDETILLLEPVE